MVTFRNLTLPNPITIASGPLTDKFTKIEQASIHQAGAVSLKLTFVEVPFQSEMRSFSLPGSVILSPTNKRLGIDDAYEMMREVKERLPVLMMANYSAVGANMDEWALMSERFLDAGTDMLEPNFCCPNLDTSAATDTKKHDHGGASIGENPDVCHELVTLMRKMTDVPIIPKIVPGQRHVMIQSAQAMQDAGADGIHIVGMPVSGLPPVGDDGTPDMPLLEGIPQGSTNGSVCRYSTYLATAQLAQAVDIPIVASGGLDTWRDVIDAIMWGASAVGICSAIMWHGWEVIEQMNEGILDFMQRRGHESIDDFRGVALKNFTTPDKVKLVKGHAQVEDDHCIGCGRCLKPGHCEAIEMVDDKAKVDPDKCIACGVCRHLCPTGAISYVVQEEEEAAAATG